MSYSCIECGNAGCLGCDTPNEICCLCMQGADAQDYCGRCLPIRREMGYNPKVIK